MKKSRQSPDRKPDIQDTPIPPVLDTYPPSMRIKTDPVTNAVIPTNEAVSAAKRWVDFNTK
ncbi:MAG: hypothetical protein RSC76_06995 [Oscillospiraceae bacterium]